MIKKKDFLFVYLFRLPVMRNASEASEAWSPSETRSSDAERSRPASAAGAEERPVPSDRQTEQNVNNAAISYIILEH